MDQQNLSVELTLVAPCFNEEGNVEVLAERFLQSTSRAGVRAEIVFVDDGSTDETRMKLRTLADIDPRIRFVLHHTNRGIVAGWESGIEASRGEYVCLIDSDLQNPPEEVLNLFEMRIRGECDLIQGVRVPVNRQPLSRRVISRGLNFVLNRSFGMSSQDNKSGFVLAKRSCLQEVVRHTGHYRHFQTFIAVSANSKGYSICEVRTQFLNRQSGQSYLAGRTLRTSIEALIDIRRARREFIIKRGM